MNPIQRKLKSRRGASITFALLIFLVCAVASSIVIVASTASAGRMSNLAEMDQRYYAVTSAAGLLKDEIDGKIIVVTAQKNGDSTSYTAKYDGVSEQPGSDTILMDVTKKLVQNAPVTGMEFTLATSMTDAALGCKIVEKLEDGLLVYTISNIVLEQSKNKATYILEIRFSPNIRQYASDSATGTTRTKVTWKFHSVKRRNYPATPGT